MSSISKPYKDSDHPRISESDLVSGRLYLQLINDFKEYEQKLKARITKLQENINEQNKLLKSICSDDPETTQIVAMQKKLQLYKQRINEKSECIKNLKEDKERLIIRCAALEKEVVRQKQGLSS